MVEVFAANQTHFTKGNHFFFCFINYHFITVYEPNECLRNILSVTIITIITPRSTRFERLIFLYYPYAVVRSVPVHCSEDIFDL
jgi:hypothetical protein